MRLIVVMLTIGYGLACLALFVRQRQMIFHPTPKFLQLPSDQQFKLPHESASPPKYLHLIPNADHARIYRPGKDSYLKAIQQFVTSIP
ncbi:MAG: hypothetical protein NW224_23545 [Leptolyngbyaceae cyanobacterium bins.302]|nr:hypothetical protein [Leptolyngbyaceae cyanobacterium bins.302]